MPLSISNLESLLKNKNFIPMYKFIVHGYCAYISCKSSDGDNVLISIPSQYKIRIHRNDTSFKIKAVNIYDEDDDTADKFADRPREEDIENTYEEIDAPISPSSTGLYKESNIAASLEESYRRKISLKDLERNEAQVIKKIYRQLKRLRYCMQNLRYKIAILHSDYICVLERDSSIEVYNIDNFPHKEKSNDKQLFFLVDLELLYEKTEHGSLNNDINNIRNSIYKILNKTQNKHVLIIDKVVSRHNILEENIKHINDKKLKYQKYMDDFNNLLKVTDSKIEELEKKMKNLEFKMKSGGGINSETGLVLEKSKAIDEIKSLKETRADIAKNIERVKEQNDELYLSSDTVIFDNIVLANAIFDNLSTMNKALR